MPTYNLIWYSDNYSKKHLEIYGTITEMSHVLLLTNSESFKSKVKITGSTPADRNTRNVEVSVSWKCWSNFCKTLEILIINCEIHLISTWSSTCIITNWTGEGTFAITDTKLLIPAVTLSTQDNAKLLKYLESGFKRRTNWN